MIEYGAKPEAIDGATPDLPDLYEGVLDSEQLGQLVADLQQCAENIQVQVRSAGGSAGSAGTTSLDEVPEILLSDGAGAVQIRYRHADEQWCDTLVPNEGGVRIVRIRQIAGESA